MFQAFAGDFLVVLSKIVSSRFLTISGLISIRDFSLAFALFLSKGNVLTFLVPNFVTLGLASIPTSKWESCLQTLSAGHVPHRNLLVHTHSTRVTHLRCFCSSFLVEVTNNHFPGPGLLESACSSSSPTCSSRLGGFKKFVPPFANDHTRADRALVTR